MPLPGSRRKSLDHSFIPYITEWAGTVPTFLEGGGGEKWGVNAVLGVPLPGERWSALNGKCWKPLSESTPLVPKFWSCWEA